MKKITLKNILTVFGIIAVILTLMPFVAMDYWWIRMFDFPHLQLTFITVFAIIVYTIKFDINAWRDYAFIGILIACCLFQLYKIYPYTPMGDYEVLDSDNNQTTLSLFTANVQQSNNKYHLLNEMIEKMDSDVMLFTETDKNWVQNIKANLDQAYTHNVEVPKDNTYGMLMYSKLPILEYDVKYLVSDSIPSIHAKLKLTAKDTIQLFAIHPTPPMPQENTMSTDRDVEMMMIAKLALESKYPVIVIGDFNDVAWSQTSKLFQQYSRLLDLRKGRGLYNTYNSKSYIMRWPLDHIFISSEFKLDTVHRGSAINSDHFPLYTKLTFEPEDRMAQQLPKPTQEILDRVHDQIDQFNKTQKIIDNED